MNPVPPHATTVSESAPLLPAQAQPVRQPSAPQPSGRLQSVDFLRGCAALAVVGAHAIHHGQAASIQQPWFRGLVMVIEQGTLGVPLFFVISGFCIHLRWAKQRAGGHEASPAFQEFWKRRMRRLYPPYFCMLCLSMAAVALAWWLRLSIDTVTRYPQPRGQWMAWDFAAHALMLHGLHPLFDESGGNPPLWTLAREEYFYLLYFLLLPLRRTTHVVQVTGLVLLTGLMVPPLSKALFQVNHSAPGVSGASDLNAMAWLWYPSNAHNSAVALWVQWCLGMVAAEAYCGLIVLPRWCLQLPMAGCWAMAAWVSDWYLNQRIAALSFSPMLWGMTFFILLNYCVERERRRQWPNHRPIRAIVGIGLFSYSLYLVHSPLLGGFNQLLQWLWRGMGWPLITDPAMHLLIWLMLIALALGVGRLFFVIVERRFWNTDSIPPRHASAGP